MRSLLRSLAFGTAALLGMATMAQQAYTWTIGGTVANCSPGQVVTVQTGQGTLPQQTITATVDPNCGYLAVLYLNSSTASIAVSTGCNGVLLTETDSAVFTSFLDTAMSVINFNCGGSNTYDCLGILNGPNVPGANCVDFFGNPGVWDVNCACVASALVDCLGLVNGPNMPGTACNDNDPNTVNDVWSPTCVCQGTAPQNCQATFTVIQNAQWTASFYNTSTGVAPIAYQWWLPDGSTSTAANPGFTFNAPGVYGVCLTITAGNACTSTMCDTVFVDSIGDITSFPTFYDCLQIPNGPNMPGTPCDDGNPATINDTWNANCGCVGIGGGTLDCYGIPGGPNLPGTACVDSIGGLIVTGIWTANCVCQTNSNPYDCLQILNGPNMPGTPCNDGDTLTVQDTWSLNCVCIGVPVNYYDCLGVLNGSDLPGTPCDDGNPGTVNDTWSANCACVGGNGLPCNADFWVLQAVTYDSLNQTTTPIPYELWVWNLSSGGSGTYTTLWSFGDGTSSTAQFPTHTYSGNGPYLLCLTIDDGMGCTSTYCDSVSIDANGLYTGMMGGGSDRQNGFTINVQGNQTTGISEPIFGTDIAAWPNPVENELNIALTNALSGTANVTITDLEGRVVLAERRMLANGRNQLLLPTATLSPGLYTVRISNGAASISQRFVKVN